jgi:hypothetical protein
MRPLPHHAGARVVADLCAGLRLIDPAEDPRRAHERVRAGRHETPSDALAALEQADHDLVHLGERARDPVLGREPRPADDLGVREVGEIPGRVGDA